MLTLTLRRDYTSLELIKVNFCFFLSLHTFSPSLLNTEVQKMICLTFVQFPWPFSWVLLTKNTHAAQKHFTPANYSIFLCGWHTHAYRALIRWSQINWMRKWKVHARCLATQAVIKIVTTSLSNCVSDTGNKNSFFRKY